MSKRKTAKEYHKEYRDLVDKKSALEIRIKKRAIELCKKFPHIKVSDVFDTKSFYSDHHSNLDDFADVNLYLNVIKKIEDYNQKQSGIVQISIFDNDLK